MEFGELKDRGQRNLIDFLQVDIQLAHTLLDTARIEADHDSDHCRRALRTAETAVSTVRQFAERVENESARLDILNRADLLQKDLTAFIDLYAS
jgi:hypothetical protein